MSSSLYHYMCKNVVGTDHHVNTIRLMNAVCNDLSSDDHVVPITSGSFGEGLQMIGSDIDVMFVLKYIEVHDNITFIAFQPTKTYFILMTDETKPCFAMLRLLCSPHGHILECCKNFRGNDHLSSALFRRQHLSGIGPVEHGPCISDKEGHSDLVYCLHSISWVKPASRWIIRSSNPWPNENTKQMIIDHGVLFVPVGNKDSANEELEWRMSFSVGEKFLIYSFSHTQLLCYALLKIILKDVINSDRRCTNLLCSYYLKTIMFWVSEELQPSVWTRGNLIPCFMRCFRRLIYCVNYSVCPHYFIHENNLFENKIKGQDRTNLIDTLRVIFSYGWRCMFFSNQISHVSVVSSCNVLPDKSIWCYMDMNKLLNSEIFLFVYSVSSTHKSFRRAVRYIMSYHSRKLKYLHTYIMSVICNKHCQSVYPSITISNKNKYKLYNTCLSYLLMNINHDAVSGWLMLASYFYKTIQYEKSLKIIGYALSKCTPEKLVRRTKLSDLERLLVKWHFTINQDVVHSLKFLQIDCIVFENLTFIPTELSKDKTCLLIPPVVYAHFLSFLCYYHLNDLHECRNSLRDLQLTISEQYLKRMTAYQLLMSYHCIGTALQLMGNNVSAKEVFAETRKLVFMYPNLFETLEKFSSVFRENINLS